MNEFTRFVRIHASDICKLGMATFDFSTMYTSFDQEVICNNVMKAFKEAQ